MKELSYNTDDCITALATGWEESALAVIRTSGGGCIEKVSGVFSRPEAMLSASGHTVVYGYIRDKNTGRTADQVLASVFRAPSSYTGEDSVEISCHGGLPAVTAVINALKSAGFRDAGPGEFTLRAFINGKIDLTRAEAVHEIVKARTGRAHELAVKRLSGALEKRMNKVRADLTDLLSKVEILLDYPEDELDGQASGCPLAAGEITAVRDDISRLGGSFSTGKLFRDGLPVALAGRTNAGKSSLFNYLLKEDRAIVSEIHGTTRDYIESWISIEGIPFRLFDTAGLRVSDNPVEAEGIKRSASIIEQAGIVLYLVDSAEGETEPDRKILSKLGGTERLVRIWSKSDQPGALPAPDGYIPLSSVTGAGLELLEKTVAAAALGKKSLDDELVIDSIRQKELLEKAAACLDEAAGAVKSGEPLDALAMELRSALDCIGEITGEVTSSDILENMFSNFCVGK